MSPTSRLPPAPAPATRPAGLDPVTAAFQGHSQEHEKLLATGRRVPLGDVGHWISASWRTFALAPLAWMWVSLLGLAPAVALTGLHYGQIVTTLVFPFYLACCGACARQVTQTGRFNLPRVAADLRASVWPLAALGALQLACSFAVVWLLASALATHDDLINRLSSDLCFGGPAWQRDALLALHHRLGAAFTLPTILMRLLIAAAVGFAPYLIYEQHLPLPRALWASFCGTLKNIPALALLGVASFFAVLATAFFLFAWCLLLPLGVVAIYVAYHDIFVSTRN